MYSCNECGNSWMSDEPSTCTCRYDGKLQIKGIIRWKKK